MQREIKFRAWHRASKQMFQWNDFSINGREGYIIHFKEGIFGRADLDDNSVELMQYTGLKDRKGQEVYEGDILDGGFTLNDDENPKYIVQFVCGCFRATYLDPDEIVEDFDFNEWLQEKLQMTDEDSLDDSFGEWQQLQVLIYDGDSRTTEVIGNIYENPELLK